MTEAQVVAEGATVRVMARALARKTGADADDLAQEGALALVEAAGRFDEGRGVTFGAYAMRRVKGAMLDHLRRTSGARTVKGHLRWSRPKEESLEGLAAEPEAEGDFTEEIADADERARAVALLAGIEARGGRILWARCQGKTLREIAGAEGSSITRVAEVERRAVAQIRAQAAEVGMVREEAPSYAAGAAPTVHIVLHVEGGLPQSAEVFVHQTDADARYEALCAEWDLDPENPTDEDHDIYLWETTIRERAPVYGEALAMVNAARRAVGAPLLEDFPQGIRDAGSACPVAEALVDVARGICAEYVNVDLHHVEFYPAAGERIPAAAAEQVAAIAAAWGAIWWDVQAEEAGVALPDAVGRFIRAFDGGEYPDLDIEEAVRERAPQYGVPTVVLAAKVRLRASSVEPLAYAAGLELEEWLGDGGQPFRSWHLVRVDAEGHRWRLFFRNLWAVDAYLRRGATAPVDRHGEVMAVRDGPPAS